MFRLLLAFIVFIWTLTGCQSGNPETADTTNPQITQTLNELVEENKLPGLNFSVIYASGRQENYSSGQADITGQLPLTPDHVLFSGSIGKTYAVAVLMQLVDEGQVNLKDRFIAWFPGVAWLKELPNIESVTIEMLLEHTSGLPRYVMKEAVWDSLRQNPDKVWSYFERMSFIFGDEAVHDPGKGWSYSDSNYILLGMLIEKITGNNYYDEVKERLLIPCGFKNTYPSVTRDIPGLPAGYSDLPEMFKMPDCVVHSGRYIFNPQMEWTGGGMASTTGDLARWAKYYYAGRLFSDSLGVQITTPNLLADSLDKNLAYGMGSFIYNTSVGKLYGHTGFVPGFVSLFGYFPEKQMAVALQTNCDWGARTIPLTAYVERILAEGEFSK